MDNVKYTDDKSLINYDEVAELYESVGFGRAADYKEDPGYEATLRQPGTHAFFALDGENHLVGLLRVFSDDRICTWVAEICVRPDRQRLGIGSQLMAMLDKRFGHTAIYVDALSGSEDFFAKQGIGPAAKLIACSRSRRDAQGAGSAIAAS